MKIEEMADVFLNLANFAPHALLTFGTPSSYALNLKALIKVTKISKTSQFSNKILHLKENLIRQTSFLQKTLLKSLRSLVLKKCD